MEGPDPGSAPAPAAAPGSSPGSARLPAKPGQHPKKMYKSPIFSRLGQHFLKMYGIPVSERLGYALIFSFRKPEVVFRTALLVLLVIIVGTYAGYIIGQAIGRAVGHAKGHATGHAIGYERGDARSSEVVRSLLSLLDPPDAYQCPEGWFRNQKKLFYFSTTEGDWHNSQKFCFVNVTSAAGIENPQKLAALLLYQGCLNHWISLWKDTDGVWRWVDGTEFDHQFEIEGDADCAYLNQDLAYSSSNCSTLRRWLCSIPDPMQQEEHAAGGVS